MKEEWIEEFEKYLSDEMDDKGREAFLRSLEEDTEKSDAFDWHRTLDEGFEQLRDRESLKKQMQQSVTLPPIGNASDAPHLTVSQNTSWIRYAAAASVVLFIGVISFLLVDDRKMDSYAVTNLALDNGTLGLVEKAGSSSEMLVQWKEAAPREAPAYRFSNNELTLKANFDKDQVRFVNLDAEGEQRTYLIYKEEFYPLYPTERFIPLEEEQNKVVIEILKRILP